MDNKKTRILIAITAALLILFKFVEMWTFQINGQYSKVILFPIAGFLFIFSIIISRKYIKKELNRIILATALCAFLTIFTKSIDFMIALMLAIICNDSKKNLETLLRSYAVSIIILSVITIIAYKLGYLPETIVYRISNGSVSAYRSNLGFYNPNTPLVYFATALSAILYLRKDNTTRKRIGIILISLAIAVLLYFRTDSRTGIITVLIILTAYALIPVFKKTAIHKIIKYYWPLLTAISIILVLSFGTTQNNMINTLLTNRLYLWKNNYLNNMPTLFGQTITSSLDNAYLELLYCGGIISAIIYSYITIKSSKELTKDNGAIMVILAFAIMGITEMNINYSMNIAIVLHMYYLISSNRG